MICIDWIVKTVFAGSRWQLLTIGTLGDLRRRIWPHCCQVCSCLQCFVKVVPKLSQSCLQVVSDWVVGNHHFDSLSVLPCLPPQYYHYYFFSIAQSPSSPVNLWQEGTLGSSGEEHGAGQGGGGEQGQDGLEGQEDQEGGEWVEEENATGTLDSIRTEGSLEEPRYAKVTGSISRAIKVKPSMPTCVST